MEQERIQTNLSEKLETTEQLEPDSTNAEKMEKEDDMDAKKNNDSGSESDEDDKKKVLHNQRKFEACQSNDILEKSYSFLSLVHFLSSNVMCNLSNNSYIEAGR
jgi:hypothetical protein